MLGADDADTLAAFDLTQRNVLTRDPNSSLPNAMVQLSHMPHVRRVVIQTNLCIGLRWLD